jgi:hypothetical protein
VLTGDATAGYVVSQGGSLDGAAVPAAPSFGRFRDYRGEAFARAMQACRR